MEADSTSDKTPEDCLETSAQEVPETMDTTLPTDGCEERSPPGNSPGDQRTCSGSRGSSLASDTGECIRESSSHVPVIQQATEDTAADIQCDSSFSESKNDADASSVPELARGSGITARDELLETAETSVSSKCLLGDDSPISTTLAEGSSSVHHCQSETEGSDNPKVAGDPKAVEASKTVRSAQAADGFPTESCNSAGFPQTAIGSQATEASCIKGSSESLRGFLSTDDTQAAEAVYVPGELPDAGSSQVPQGSFGRDHSQATECSQPLRGSNVTESVQAMECSQAMESPQTQEDKQAVDGSKSSEVPQVGSRAALGLQVPVLVGADSTIMSATNIPSNNFRTPAGRKGDQDTSCNESRKGVRTSGKLRIEDDDLYSEIIATTTKVKILKKYFGDTRKPGLCHRPHHKKYYGSFKCTECDLSFSYLPSLLFHSNKHGKRYHRYKCFTCSYESSAPGAFTKHELSHHPDKLFRCHECDSTFLQKSTLRRHKEATHPLELDARATQWQAVDYVCKLCKGLFTSQSTLIQHLKLQHVILADSWPRINISSSDAVVERSNQPNTSFYDKFYHVVPRRSTGSQRCKKCKALFPMQGLSFYEHGQAYQVSIKAACLWCGYRGSSACDLSCHKRRVHNWCLICNWKLGTKELLKQHTKFVHHGFRRKEGFDKGIESQEKRKQKPHQPSTPEHRCSHCSRRFSSEVRLEQHIKQVHNQKMTAPVIVNNEAVQHWYCTTCNVIFPTKRLLELHIMLNHRPMKKTETSPLVRVEPTAEDQEWRCLLCNTVHHTLEECDKHQIANHPDEYEYISRKEISEPSLPLPVSALSDPGPPYTCNMCDSTVASAIDLHEHKEQFHKIAYTISINDAAFPKSSIHRCRYRCGFANCIRKHVLKHEPMCPYKTTGEPKVWSRPPAVLDSSSGEMVHKQGSASAVSDLASTKEAQELEADPPEAREETGPEEDPGPDSIIQDKSNEASSEKDVSRSMAGRYEETVTPASGNRKPDHSQALATVQSGRPKPSQPSTSGFISTSEKDVSQSMAGRQEETVKPASSNGKPDLSQTLATIRSGRPKPSQPPELSQPSTSGLISTSVVNKTLSGSSVKQSPSSKLHDLISSNSDEDSNCSWLDRSSDSGDSVEEAILAEDSVVDSPASSEEEGGQPEPVQEVPTLYPQGQASGYGVPNAQVKPVSTPTSPCPPLLQPTVLMRFFQAIDLSDLYRLALQMITGSPQPHSLPTSDPGMISSKVAKFKYKIPLGHSHPEFKEMPLFPNSREVYMLGNLQTLPSSLISKHYKGVLAKPFHKHLSSLVDSAVLNNFSENTIKGIERYVKKQRLDDRRDITSNLSRYIVSQYVKNQQKKPPGTQPISTANNPAQQPTPSYINLLANSPGAGPSGALSSPPAFRLVVRKSSTPVSTVSYRGMQPSTVNASGIQMQANLVRHSLPLVKTVLPSAQVPVQSTFNLGVPSAVTVVNTSAANKTNPSDMAGRAKNTQSSKHRSGKTVPPVPKVRKSSVATKSPKRKPAVYSIPVRRSPRLLKSAGDLQSPSGSSNGLTKLEKCDTSSKQNTKPDGKKSRTSETTVDNGTKELEEAERGKNETKFNKKPASGDKCKESQSQTTEDGTDRGNPRFLPKTLGTTIIPQSGLTGISVVQRNCSTAGGPTPQISINAVPNNKHNLMLQLIASPGLQLVSFNPKLQQGGVLAETVDRDGVMQTKMARHPLQGLNGGTAPRLIAPTIHVNRQAVPLNGKAFFGGAPVSVNLQQKPLSKILPKPSLKACGVQVNPQRSSALGLKPVRGDTNKKPVVHPDTTKNAPHVTLDHEDVSKSGKTSPGFGSPPSKEQLSPELSTQQASTGDQPNSTENKWKMTLTRDDVLASMARRKLQGYVPYKPLPNENPNESNGNTEVNSKDRSCDTDENNTTSKVSTLKRKAEQRLSQSLSKLRKGVYKGINDCCSGEAVPDESLNVHPLVCGPDDSEKSGHTLNPNQSNPQSVPSSCVEGDGEQRSQTEQTAESTKEEKTSNDSENLAKEESCLYATSRISVKTTPDTTDETNITRRSLRRRAAKRKKESATKIKNKTQKTTVDHSYMKNPRPGSSDNSRKLRALRQHSKRLGMPRGAERDHTRSKTKADQGLVPHDHSYTGSRPERSSPRLKATSKMDHSYFWKTQDGMRATEDSNDAVVVGKVTSGVDGKLLRAENLKGSAEDHASSHDHSYSTSFPEQVRDQMAAMDHCYVRLTPISIGSERTAPKATTIQSSSTETFHAERKRRKVGEVKSGSSDIASGPTKQTRHQRRSCDRSQTK